MKGKKGEKTLSLMIGIIIMAVLVIIIIIQLNKSGDELDKVIGGNIKSLSSDYDNDGIPDKLDHSPCVTGEQLINAKDGRTYFLLSADPNDCKNSTGGVKEGLKIVKDDQTIEREVCVITREECAKTLKEYYKELENNEKD